MSILNPNSPALKSWVDIPQGSDFPIQNLPFGIFKNGDSRYAGCIAIGDHVIDLAYLQENDFLSGLELPKGIFTNKYLNDFLALGKKKGGEVRRRISELLRHDSEYARKITLIPMKDVKMQMPVTVPNYTDFYSSEYHAFNVGSMFRDPKNALLPNWKHLPVGYHGRASSIVVSGTPIHRPKGQSKPNADAPPVFGPTSKLDFELEVAFVSCGDTALGTSVSVEEAADNIFGFVLFNDWSARDIQSWEYVPLGPFLAKNFGSTISPWIVTMDALEPFMVEGPKQEPEVLPYLASQGKKNFDINLEVSIRETVISRSNFKHMYWNVFQQLAHHTVNGCNIQVGDLYASGTISGPEKGSYGSMLELTWNGQQPIQLKDGSMRKFIEDGDVVTIKGFAERDGVRIGFGECRGEIVKAG
jgi:fumarylacetoacetase